MILESYNRFGNSDTISFIESMEYLDEYESTFDPSMVSIVYNNRLDKELIKLENFVEYADSNYIDDGGEAIANVCKENNVLVKDIGFMVEEASVLEDTNIFITAKQLRENGFLIVINPMNRESIYYQALEEAVTLDDNYSTYADSTHLISYCEEFAPLEKVKEIGRSIKKRVGENYDKIKGTLSEAPNKLAKKLSAIKTMIAEKNKALRTAAGDAKVKIKNQISKLKDAFGVVKKKLIAAKDTVVSGAKSAGKWVSDKAGAARDSVVGFKNRVFS